MQNYAYLLTLLVALSGMFMIDRRYKLAWFWNRRRTATILALVLAFFLLWDIVNISANIIHTNPAWVSGLHVFTPDLPVEEFLFLILLGYQTLLLWRWQCTRS